MGGFSNLFALFRSQIINIELGGPLSYIYVILNAFLLIFAGFID